MKSLHRTLLLLVCTTAPACLPSGLLPALPALQMPSVPAPPVVALPAVALPSTPAVVTPPTPVVAVPALALTPLLPSSSSALPALPFLGGPARPAVWSTAAMPFLPHTAPVATTSPAGAPVPTPEPRVMLPVPPAATPEGLRVPAWM